MKYTLVTAFALSLPLPTFAMQPTPTIDDLLRQQEKAIGNLYDNIHDRLATGVKISMDGPIVNDEMRKNIRDLEISFETSLRHMQMECLLDLVTIKLLLAKCYGADKNQYADHQTKTLHYNSLLIPKQNPADRAMIDAAIKYHPVPAETLNILCSEKSQ